jgi:hypothetical protein
MNLELFVFNGRLFLFAFIFALTYFPNPDSCIGSPRLNLARQRENDGFIVMATPGSFLDAHIFIDKTYG